MTGDRSHDTPVLVQATGWADQWGYCDPVSRRQSEHTVTSRLRHKHDSSENFHNKSKHNLWKFIRSESS